MTEQYEDDQFEGYVSANNKNRYDYFNDIQPEQEQTQIHNTPLFAANQFPLYNSQNIQQIPDISILYQNQPLNQQSLFNPNSSLQLNSTLQNDIQQNPIISIPQVNNTAQTQSQNLNGHLNYEFQSQQRQQNQAYDDEEFQEGEFIEVQKPVQIEQTSLLEDQPNNVMNGQNYHKNNSEKQDQLINFEISQNQDPRKYQEQQQNIQTIQQEPKNQVQLSSIYDAFPSEQNETPSSSLFPSLVLQIPQTQFESQNDQKITNNLNLIEMYQKTLTSPKIDLQIIQNEEPKENFQQSKTELINLIDFHTQPNQTTLIQLEQQSNSLLQFSNQKIDQQQLDVQQQSQQSLNNTLSLYDDLGKDSLVSQQNQSNLDQKQNYSQSLKNHNLIEIKEQENQEIQEETKTQNQEDQCIQPKLEQMIFQSIKQEGNHDNNDNNDDEFVEGEQIESPLENNVQNLNIQVTNSTILNQQYSVLQNPQIIPQVQKFQDFQQQQFDQQNSQQQIQFQQKINQANLNNQYQTLETNIKQGPQRSQPIKKRNWRNQIEDIVGFDAECMDSFIEELSDLKLNLYMAQVQEYAQLAKDIQALRKKKQIHVDKEEYEEATVIRDTLRAKEPIAMVLKKKILQIAKVIDLMDQQDLDYHIKRYIFDHDHQIPENPSIDMLLPKIEIFEDFVNKLKKELKKSESVLSIIKLQGQLEKVRYEKKYQIFIQGLRKIIGMSCRFTQLSEIVQSVNDRLSDLKIDKEVNKFDYEFIFENTLIPFLKGQQFQQNYCNYCFQSKSDLIEYKGKLYDICCLNFYYNIN
ncbi:unnamed protein product [Paramecium sonneborni]|uniref:UVR domain-containing protein n=1 Tax=Paramecium sonneborni TaxID=65129 RepID=A0A8S1NQJ4_9CILI|nr:unnamed protein product [Paramecium sonneborni]